MALVVVSSAVVMELYANGPSLETVGSSVMKGFRHVNDVAVAIASVCATQSKHSVAQAPAVTH
jgi:hypothetical protein